jgi:hypothetical protein
MGRVSSRDNWHIEYELVSDSSNASGQRAIGYLTDATHEHTPIALEEARAYITARNREAAEQ